MAMLLSPAISNDTAEKKAQFLFLVGDEMLTIYRNKRSGPDTSYDDTRKLLTEHLKPEGGVYGGEKISKDNALRWRICQRLRHAAMQSHEIL